ncbi:MAG: hypothetical protein DDT18_01738 [Actinobacteria bacterium]|nr:hypothetical protein [Actinomycetota bacterium]
MIFEHLFCPSSVAVIGAAREEGKVGYEKVGTGDG